MCRSSQVLGMFVWPVCLDYILKTLGHFFPFLIGIVWGGVQVGMGWQAGEVSLGYVYTER